MGHDLARRRQVRGEIAMTGQFASLDEDLTGRENLVMLAGCGAFAERGPRTGRSLLAAFELAERRPSR